MPMPNGDTGHITVLLTERDSEEHLNLSIRAYWKEMEKSDWYKGEQFLWLPSSGGAVRITFDERVAVEEYARSRAQTAVVAKERRALRKHRSVPRRA